jgi:hypothetical protein
MQGDVSAGAASADFESSLSRARGGGSPLGAKVRGQMESAMGADFSGVKIHTDNRSDQLNRSIQAKAFTTGNDIFFQQGAYNPSSSGGQALIAHELTHTIQQGATQSQVQRILTDEVNTLADYKEKSKKIDDSKKNIENAYKFLTHYNQVILAGLAPNKEHDELLTKANQKLEWHLVLIDGKEEPFEGYRESINNIRIAINRECNSIGEYRDLKNNKLEYLGGGAINTVYSTVFGDDWEAVWKEDQAELLHGDGARLARIAGIGEIGEAKSIERDSGEDKMMEEFTSQKDMNVGSRNIAMYRLDQLLGTGVMPRTERAKLKGKAGTVMTRERGTELRDFVENKEEKSAEEILMTPAIQRGLSNLQLLDAIAGQIDRHAGNIIVTIDEKTGKAIEIRGIDNDFAFGIRTEADSEVPISHNRGFPEMIDNNTADKILGIEENKVREVLEGLLTKAEIDQTVFRFTSVQNYIKNIKVCQESLDGKGIIKEWNEETYKKQLEISNRNIEERESKARDEDSTSTKTAELTSSSRSYLYQHVESAKDILDAPRRKAEEERIGRERAERNAEDNRDQAHYDLAERYQQRGRQRRRPNPIANAPIADAPIADTPIANPWLRVRHANNQRQMQLTHAARLLPKA